MSDLSILIPTLTERYKLLHRLQRTLLPQVEKYPGRVFVHYNDQGRSVCIGDKRNQLVSMVTTDYLVQIDDDDQISNNYLSEILTAMESSPDVITFNGWMTTNGHNRKNFVIKLGERYEERNGVYYRHPNHLCPIKTHLARRVPFPSVASGEDYGYAVGLKQRNILKTSVHINQDLYHYQYISNKPPYGNQSVRVRR
jgi:glycosyltransferase involved in cell wall biosynthesis